MTRRAIGPCVDSVAESYAEAPAGWEFSVASAAVTHSTRPERSLRVVAGSTTVLQVLVFRHRDLGHVVTAQGLMTVVA